jgi:hypothetical protein
MLAEIDKASRSVFILGVPPMELFDPDHPDGAGSILM